MLHETIEDLISLIALAMIVRDEIHEDCAFPEHKTNEENADQLEICNEACHELRNLENEYSLLVMCYMDGGIWSAAGWCKRPVMLTGGIVHIPERNKFTHPQWFGELPHEGPYDGWVN